jgi:hypothetical protein
MESLTQSRLASFLTLALGVWLAISPSFISVSGGAKTNLIVVGVIIGLAGFIQMFWHSTLPSWVVGLGAIYLLISAFAYNVSNAVTWNMILSSAAAFMLATWDGVEVSAFQHQQRVIYK